MYSSEQINPSDLNSAVGAVTQWLSPLPVETPFKKIVLATALEKVAAEYRQAAAYETAQSVKVQQCCKAMEAYMADLLFAINAKEEGDRDSRLIEAANLIQQQIAGLRREFT